MITTIQTRLAFFSACISLKIIDSEIKTKSLKATPFHTHFLLFIRAIISLKDTIASPKKMNMIKASNVTVNFF